MDTRNNNSTDFDSIYMKAKRLDLHKLKTEFAGYACVNVRDSRGLFSPAARHAADGNHESVALLSKFNASQSQIAMGYASVGNQEAAEIIRKNHGINLELLAIGAAMHEDVNYAEWLRSHYHLNPAWFVFGASLVGNVQYAERLLNSLIPTNTDLQRKQHETAMCMHIKGLVMGGKLDHATRILDQNRNQQSALYLKEAIEAAGQVADLFNIGELDHYPDDGPVPFLFRNGRQPHLLEEFRYRAAIGAAKGGHIQLAKTIFAKTEQRQEERDKIILAAMTNGHITETLQHFPCPSDLSLRDNQFLLHPLTLQAAVFGGHDAIYADITNKKVDASLVAAIAQTGDLNMTRDLAAISKPILERVVERMDSDRYFQSEDVLLYALTFALTGNNIFVKNLADTALRIKSDEMANRALNQNFPGRAFLRPFFYNFHDIYKRASKICAAMDRLDLNYDQAKAYLEAVISFDAGTVSRLLENVVDPIDVPVLTALSTTLGAKLSEEKELQYDRIHHVIAAGRALKYFKDTPVEKLPDQGRVKVEVRLCDLIAKLAFNGFSVDAIASNLSVLTGLTVNDAGDLYEKFCRRVLKQTVDDMLFKYINYNNESSMYEAPFTRLWEITKRPYDMLKHAHTGRAESVRQEVAKLESRSSVLGIFRFTKELFEKQVAPSKSDDGAKWKQPLDNTSRDDEFYKISKQITNSRLSNN